jgi:ADP-ribose pyrophosphatase
VGRNPVSISQEILCKGKRFTFAKLTIDFGDKRIMRDLLVHPGAVVIIPILINEHIVMLRQYRPGPLDWVVELPAGTIEAGEDPRSTAERELLEETGYRAGELRELFKMYSSPGVSSEVLHVFLAKQLTYEGSSHQEDEAIEVIKISIKEAIKMIRSGEIVDGKTIASLLYYVTFFTASNKSYEKDM